MRRVIELVSALAATTTGLIGVVTEVRVIAYPYDSPQIGGPAAFGTQSWSVMSTQINHFMVLLALLLIGLSVGAYLHAIYRSVWGLAILWVSTGSLVVSVGYVTLTPPAFGYTGGSISAVALDVVPTALSVVTVVLAAVAAMAAITPLRAVTPGRSTMWSQRLDRVLHSHPPV
jgi:hypothetical protein